jgi:hypothetical protein
MHSPAIANAAKTAAIIDLRMLNSSALDVSPLHDPVTSVCPPSLTQLGVSASSYSLGISDLIEQRIKAIGGNPYGEADPRRAGSIARFDPLSTIGRLGLMINLLNAAEPQRRNATSIASLVRP